MTTRSRLAEIRGAVALARQGFSLVAGEVHALHRAISALPFRVTGAVPGAGPMSDGVRVVHDGITDAVYLTVRGTGELLLGATEAALGVVERVAPATTEEAQHPLAVDASSAVQGLVGDAMAAGKNPLRIRAGFYQARHRLRLRRDFLETSFPAATPRLVVFVHGLSCSETRWMAGEDPTDPATHHYGARLEARGFTPLYVRYNSGLPVVANGRTLARLLATLVREWPVPVEELVLVGHSMGGLVCRSACHHGAGRAAPWTTRVSSVVCLGSPHAGAPLAKAASLAARLLRHVELGAPVARVLEVRSEGIRDLDHGTITTGAPPLPLPHARYLFIGSTLHGKAHHPLGWAFGDGLVRPGSATRAADIQAHTVILPGIHHLGLMNHPEVFRVLDAWLDAAPGATTAAELADPPGLSGARRAPDWPAERPRR